MRPSFFMHQKITCAIHASSLYLTKKSCLLPQNYEKDPVIDGCIAESERLHYR